MNHDNPILKPVSSFRLNGKRLFLTYSQTSLTKEEVIEQLKAILVYLKFYSKVNVLNTNKLDLTDSSDESVRNNVPELNYIERQEAAESISRRIRKVTLKDSLIIQNITKNFVTNNIIVNA